MLIVWRRLSQQQLQIATSTKSSVSERSSLPVSSSRNYFPVYISIATRRVILMILIKQSISLRKFTLYQVFLNEKKYAQELTYLWFHDGNAEDAFLYPKQTSNILSHIFIVIFYVIYIRCNFPERGFYLTKKTYCRRVCKVFLIANYLSHYFASL